MYFTVFCDNGDVTVNVAACDTELIPCVENVILSLAPISAFGGMYAVTTAVANWPGASQRLPKEKDRTTLSMKPIGYFCSPNYDWGFSDRKYRCSSST